LEDAAEEARWRASAFMGGEHCAAGGDEDGAEVGATEGEASGATLGDTDDHVHLTL
jgi:hypothetical protein